MKLLFVETINCQSGIKDACHYCGYWRKLKMFVIEGNPVSSCAKCIKEKKLHKKKIEKYRLIDFVK
jgi:hypothetical protein